MITLSWIKCQSGDWCGLEKVNLSNVSTIGVYIIWHGGNPGRVVRVGQGIIADRLSDHRSDSAILAYNKNGTLYATWAYVSAHQRDAVEAYLAQTWTPLVGDRFPDVLPLAVNSLWS